MAALPSELVGTMGRRYRSKDLLQERPHAGRVWTALSGRDTYLMKDVPINIFSHFKELILPRLSKQPSPLLRIPVDEIPDQHVLVYKYLTEDFLRLVQKEMSMQARRDVLRATLQAIADLHERDVVHLGKDIIFQ
ncbi:uncharacterized protein RCC_06745 [Ramularia collo-cygni]|uniref:Protein kinase domain-containing protein n=1 Tax=Ramularia collo-cygni TaxID=112498 RepID=A0A2D3V2E6_9PEZI|nr:uncharacterized protein RCC_06745 [Ramularia collo-cygni]CZT20885.1 uncharacterized protein RCC_06745 [Ramularia collo-cygni]